LNTHELATASTDFKFDEAVDSGKNGVIFSHANVGSRVELRAVLPHDNIAGNDGLSTELLHTKTLALAVTPVAAAAASFFCVP